MKKILAILSIVLTMFISSESLARHHGGGFPGPHGGPHYVHHGHHGHHGDGWLFPLGLVLGSALTYTATRPVYQEPVYVQQPVYVQPQPVYYQQPVYTQPQQVIIRTPNCYNCYY